MRTLVVVAALTLPAIASAHVALTDPPPRTMMLKNRQCGDPAAPRSANPKVLAPGSTYTVKWLETVDHPGHYRISFDNDGTDFFVPPNATASTMGMDPTVMIDLIPDVQGNFPAAGRMYSQTITLPNIECTNCTLQLIQMMTDKPPYTTALTSDDIYYQCADIVLSSSAPPPPPMVDAGVTSGDSGTTDPGATEGGCNAGGGSGIAVTLAALGLVIARRRRR
jgi:uncharacterized protein (TIGR03382 family)